MSPLENVEWYNNKEPITLEVFLAQASPWACSKCLHLLCHTKILRADVNSRRCGAFAKEGKHL